jgi:hypothetical protein
MPHQDYVWRKPRLLKDFDRSVGRVEGLLAARFVEGQARALREDAHAEYEALVPQIPYIGDKSPFLVFLLPTSRLAVYRALRRHGRTVEDAGQVVNEMGEAELRAIPRPARRLIGYLWFSSWFTSRLRRRAAESQRRTYPGDYVFTFVQGNGQGFDFGIDYEECASCKFLDAQDAGELAPYVCAVDKAASETLGWGLFRTMTLAEGGGRCDFRFKRGGKTDVRTPEGRPT